MELIISPSAKDGINEEINSFITFIGLDKIAPGRYSQLLVCELFVGCKYGHQNPAPVIQEIELLEKGRRSCTKLPSQFKRPPLQGLWYKYYINNGLLSLVLNIQDGIGKYNIPIFKNSNKKYSISNNVSPSIHDILSNNLDSRINNKHTSGEWIVLSKYNEKNYYLCVSNDNDNNEKLRLLINEICGQEFSFIKNQFK